MQANEIALMLLVPVAFWAVVIWGVVRSFAG